MKRGVTILSGLSNPSRQEEGGLLSHGGDRELMGNTSDLLECSLEFPWSTVTLNVHT